MKKCAFLLSFVLFASIAKGQNDVVPPIIICYGSSTIKIKAKNAKTSLEIEEALATVIEKDSEKELDREKTDFQGNASLFLDSAALGSLRAEVQKTADPLKGLTTFDLAQNMERMLQHITGTKPFTQNWQYIAADMDRNNRVDSADIIACRKAVLGFINDTLPLWRFYPETHVFPKPDPLSEPIPQGYDFLGTAIPAQTLVFMGVEMCRVEAQTSNTNEPDHRIEASIVPNPSAGTAYLQFYSPDYESVIFETIDASGRSVFRQSMNVNSGNVQIEIPAEALPSPGIYFWRLAVRDQSAAGKIIRSE